VAVSPDSDSDSDSGCGTDHCTTFACPAVTACHPMQRRLISNVPYVESQWHGNGAENGLISTEKSWPCTQPHDNFTHTVGRKDAREQRCDAEFLDTIRKNRENIFKQRYGEACEHR
jgi:hypothetical protein